MDTQTFIARVLGRHAVAAPSLPDFVDTVVTIYTRSPHDEHGPDNHLRPATVPEPVHPVMQ